MCRDTLIRNIKHLRQGSQTNILCDGSSDTGVYFKEKWLRVSSLEIQQPPRFLKVVIKKTHLLSTGSSTYLILFFFFALNFVKHFVNSVFSKALYKESLLLFRVRGSESLPRMH